MFAKLRNKVSTPPPPVATTGSPTSSSSEITTTNEKSSSTTSLSTVYIPFSTPSSESHIPSEPELTQEQKDKYLHVLNHFQQSDLKIAISEETHKHKQKLKN